MKKLILASCAIAMTLAACTAKKRDTALPYGADRNLLNISDFDGKEFDLTTTGIASKNVHTSSSTQISDETEAVQFHDVVTYKTDAELMDNSPFLGKTNKTYKVKYVLEDTKLKIYKVGAEKDFSYEEKSASQFKKLGDGRLAAPILSYSVSYFSTDNSRNENDEVTHRLQLLDQDSKEKSKFFKINPNSKELATYLKKDLHFDSQFFDGEWFFGSSIVSQNFEVKGGEDRTILEWISRGDARVAVKKEENKITFYSLNIDKQLTSDLAKREENQVPVLVLGAAWKDYRMSLSGKGTSVHEEEDTTKPWDQRKFMQLNVAQISMPAIGRIAQPDVSVTSEMRASLRDVQIGTAEGRRYFSFLVYLESAKSLVRYAFLEAKPISGKTYTPRYYLKTDRQIFGFFSTDRRTLKSVDRQNEADYVDTHFVNRFNPNLGKLEFHPSIQTPAWSLDVAKAATEAWDKAFQEAGTNLKIEFNPTPVNLGDIRYNVINIIADADGNDPWWGFGPSLADGNTGEILSATANINITSMIQYTRATIRSYLRHQKGEITGSYIIDAVLDGAKSVMNMATGALDIIQDATYGAAQNIGLNLDPRISGQKGKNGENLRFIPIKDPNSNGGVKWTSVNLRTKNIPESSFSKRQESNFNLINPNITKEIETLSECSEVKSYAGKLASGGNYIDQAEERKLIEPCALAILKPRVTNTLLHEMGHNFGLRHNFYGNTDSLNFFKDKNGTPIVRSSSVMEYPVFDESNLITPGYYDIAAIKWAYTGKLLAAGRTQDLVNYDITKPIQSQNAANEMHKFKYCSDEEAQGLSYDPMCALHDSGTSATETVEYYIKLYQLALAGRQNLEEGKILPKERNDFGQATFTKFFLPMKRFYDYYRNIIRSEMPTRAYLDDETKESFSKMLSEIEERLKARAPGINIDIAGLDHKATLKKITEAYAAHITREERKYVEFLDYKLASDIVYNFFKTLAFMPDRYCMVSSKSNQAKDVKLLSFEILQREVFDQTGNTVISCKDKGVSDILASKGNSLILEVGFPVEDIQRNLSYTHKDYGDSAEAPAALGTLYDRGQAFIALAERSPSLTQNFQYKFYPNYYDEPAKREELENLVVDRLTNGVDSTSLGITKTLADLGITGFHSRNFVSEKILLKVMYATLAQGELIPDHSVTNSKRIERFMVHNAMFKQPTEKSKTFRWNGGTYIVTPEAEMSYKLVDSVEKVNALKLRKLPAEAILKKVHDTVMENALTREDGKGKFTVGNLIDSMNKTGETLDKEKEAEEMSAFMGLWMDKEIGVFVGLMPAVDKINKMANKKEAKKALEELRAKDLLELFNSKAKTEDEKLKPFKEDLEIRYTETINAIMASEKAYREDQEEIDAQSEVLMNAINILSQ